MGVFGRVTTARQRPFQKRFRVHGDGPRLARELNRAKAKLTVHAPHDPRARHRKTGSNPLGGGRQPPRKLAQVLLGILDARPRRHLVPPRQ